MVNIVDNSLTFEPNNQQETNRELAKEVCDLRLKLSQAREVINDNQSEILKKNLELIELKAEINDLMIFRKKYNAILDVVMDRKQTNSIRNSTTHDIPLALPEPVIRNSITNESILERSIINAQQSNTQQERHANYSLSFSRISERTEEESSSSISDMVPIHDSLEPCEVTSVPPLLPERFIPTPSIWKCLDSTPEITPESNSKQVKQNNSHDASGIKVSTNFNSDSPIQLFNKNRITKSICDMLHSTPVRVQDFPQIPISIDTSIDRHSTGDNQENVKVNNANGNKKKQVEIKNKQPAVKRKRQPAKAQSGAAKRANVAENSDSQPRYNLRKRTKA